MTKRAKRHKMFHLLLAFMAFTIMVNADSQSSIVLTDGPSFQAGIGGYLYTFD